MDLLLILTYTALCVAVFKVFKIPLNKWTVPTAVLGGVILIGTLILLMNYNHPFTQLGSQVYSTTPIVSGVRGRVVEVPVKPNQPLTQGDVLFRIDPIPFEADVARLKAKVKEASQGALGLESTLKEAQAAVLKAIESETKRNVNMIVINVVINVAHLLNSKWIPLAKLTKPRKPPWRLHSQNKSKPKSL